MKECRLDFETRGDVDLKTQGVYRYVESPHFKVLIACYSIDGGPVQTWTYDQPPPLDLWRHIASGGLIRAFNASFERLCLRTLHERAGWPAATLEQFRCTAVEGAAMALPRKLDHICEALGVKATKDKRGAALIRKFSIPRAPGPVWNEPEDHPKEFAEFVAYCQRDVEAEAEVASRLIPLSATEWRVYQINERINDRGLRIDTVSARAALALAEKAKRHIDEELRALTGGAVKAVTEIARLKAWCEERYVTLATMGKDDIEDALAFSDVPEDVRRALELRQEGGKTSVSKIAAMLRGVCADGRVHGVYLHHGAGATGRFSSKICQMHNLTKPRKIYEDARIRQAELFEAIRHGDPGFLTTLYGDKLGRPLHLLADATRGFIWAERGYELLDVDYSAIEGRMAAWLAGETWKLDAYRALDRGEGHGLYELTAADIFGIDIKDVNRQRHRPAGKIGELALGYLGGAGALIRAARKEKVDLRATYPVLWESSDDTRRGKAVRAYEKRVRRKDDLIEQVGREAYLAAELIKIGWRAKNQMIEKAWHAYEAAAIDAVRSPGHVAEALHCRYLVRHGFLWCQLPSGRCLAYGAPKLVDQVWAKQQLLDGSWTEDSDIMDRSTAVALGPKARIEGEAKPRLTVRGVGDGGQWARYPLHGGVAMNNNTQGAARDVLVHGMLNAEDAGFEIVLHTHDEAAAEVRRGSRSVEEFESVMSVLPAWAEGLPLTASGWRGKRYKKD